MAISDPLPRLTGCWRRQCPPSGLKPCWAHYRKTSRPGIDIFGYLLSEIGLGEAARLLVRAADAAEIPASATNIPLKGRQGAHEFEPRLDGPSDYRASLTVTAILDLKRLRHRTCRRRWNIVLPYWELQHIPEVVLKYADRFDGFWAPSTFIHDALCARVRQPVNIVHQPIDTSSMRAPASRDGNSMLVLCHFDYDSYVARKNPEAAVRAFQAAFPRSVKDVQLIVKTRGRQDSGRRTWLTDTAADDPRIKVVDQTLSRSDMMQLMHRCHAYLSMHRSEGFGLGCAEALCSGLAVIATDYGGSTDFVTQETGFPVEWTPLALEPGDYIEGTGAEWADPVIEHAAEILRSIYDDSAVARQRTIAGQDLLERQHSIRVAGERMKQILKNDGML